MELNFLNEQGKTVDVNEAVFGREYNVRESTREVNV